MWLPVSPTTHKPPSKTATTLKEFVPCGSKFLTFRVVLFFLKKKSVYLFRLSNGSWLIVWRFYGPVDPLGSWRAQSVYLTILILGRRSTLSNISVLVHILSPEADNWASWISGRKRKAIENISWSPMGLNTSWKVIKGSKILATLFTGVYSLWNKFSFPWRVVSFGRLQKRQLMWANLTSYWKSAKSRCAFMHLKGL